MIRIDYIINDLISELDDAEIELLLESVKKKTN